MFHFLQWKCDIIIGGIDSKPYFPNFALNSIQPTVCPVSTMFNLFSNLSL